MSETKADDSGEYAVANTDRELWREPSEAPGMEYYAPSIHVTERGGIGINVGGLVIVKSLREWHAYAVPELKRAMEEARHQQALAYIQAQEQESSSTTSR